MRTFLREPLVHFVLLGAGLFVVYQLRSTPAGSAAGKIVVTQAQLEHLAVGFARTWQRPPTEEERDGLLRDYIREEVYCREALAMGLDRDDVIIRRRLQQKMEFISEDVAAVAAPSDADLRAYLRAHPDAFRIEPRLTFRHVYLDPQRRGDALRRDAAALLEHLNRDGDGTGADMSTLGDPWLLDHDFDAVPVGEIAKQFGDAFAARLTQVPPRRWYGPVDSGYGAHLVLITDRTESRDPALEEVREAVHREWMSAQRRKANEDVYASLLRRYEVSIEAPPDAPTAKLAAAEVR